MLQPVPSCSDLIQVSETLDSGAGQSFKECLLGSHRDSSHHLHCGPLQVLWRHDGVGPRMLPSSLCGNVWWKKKALWQGKCVYTHQTIILIHLWLIFVPNIKIAPYLFIPLYVLHVIRVERYVAKHSRRHSSSRQAVWNRHVLFRV